MSCYLHEGLLIHKSSQGHRSSQFGPIIQVFSLISCCLYPKLINLRIFFRWSLEWWKTYKHHNIGHYNYVVLFTLREMGYEFMLEGVLIGDCAIIVEVNVLTCYWFPVEEQMILILFRNSLVQNLHNMGNFMSEGDQNLTHLPWYLLINVWSDFLNSQSFFCTSFKFFNIGVVKNMNLNVSLGLGMRPTVVHFRPID